MFFAWDMDCSERKEFSMKRKKVYLNYIGQFKVPEAPVMMTEEEKAEVAKKAEKLRRKRESNRKYMKKIRELSK